MQLPTFRAADDALLVAMLAKALAHPGGAPPTPSPKHSAAVDRDACRRDMASALAWARHHRNDWRGFDAVSATKATAGAHPRQAAPPSATPATSPPVSAPQASPPAAARSATTRGHWVSALFGQQPGKFTFQGNSILGAIMAATNPAG